MTDREFQVWLAVYLQWLKDLDLNDKTEMDQKFAAKEANQAVWELRAAEETLKSGKFDGYKNG